MYHFHRFAKDRKEKINELQAITFDEESAKDSEKRLAPPKRAKRLKDVANFFDLKTFLGVEKTKVANQIVCNAFSQSFAPIGAILGG